MSSSHDRNFYSASVVKFDAPVKTHSITPRLSLTIVEAAGAVGISRRQIYVELQSRRLASIKVGKRRLIPTEELKRWLRTRPPG